MGIESEYVLLKKETDNIRHWFIVAKGNNDKQYFLTLAADLGNIKNGFPTEHFADNFNALDDQGNLTYEIPKNTKLKLRKNRKNGIEFVEIDHEILSQKYLQSLDESIGYSNLYDLTSILKQKHNFFVKDYMKTLQEKSEIFNIYRECFGFDEENAIHFSDINKEQVALFNKKLALNVLKGLDNLSGNTNTNQNPELCDLYIKEYLISSLKNIGINTDGLYKKTIKEIINENNKEIRYAKKDKQKQEQKAYDLRVVDIILHLKRINDLFYIYSDQYQEDVNNRFTKLCNLLEKCNNYDQRQELIGNFKQQLASDRENVGMRKLNPVLLKLTLLLDDSYETKKHDYISLDYVYSKFTSMFPKVFDCNFENYQTKKSTNFSVLGYNEQIEAIKKMLNEIFKELDKYNSDKIINYDFKYSAVENRIQPFPIFNPETREYYVGFAFGRTKEEPERMLIYYPRENKLAKVSAIETAKKYWFVSTRFNMEIDAPRTTIENTTLNETASNKTSNLH